VARRCSTAVILSEAKDLASAAQILQSLRSFGMTVTRLLAAVDTTVNAATGRR